MLLINNVKVPLELADYRKIISQQLNISKNKIFDVKLVKQAVDARRKNKVHFVCSLILLSRMKINDKKIS